MIVVPYPIVVEGRYDEIKLRAFVQADIIVTHGFRIFHDPQKLRLIQRLASKTKIVILTDSDDAGFRIRHHIAGALPPDRVVHLYIPEITGKERRKSRPSAKGTVGVEGVSVSILKNAFEQAGLLSGAEPQASITKTDLFRLGLSGAPNSTALRQALLKQLDLPSGLGANALCGVLGRFYSVDELSQTVETLRQQLTATSQQEKGA